MLATRLFKVNALEVDETEPLVSVVEGMQHIAASLREAAGFSTERDAAAYATTRGVDTTGCADWVERI
jgi:hypothetical protein